MASNGHVNGEGPPRFIDPKTFDPDDPIRERELMKSVEVREDMRAMDARKRVSEILNSEAFREELEEIIETQETVPTPGAQLKSGPHPASLIALQQISQLILPGSSSTSSKLASASVPGPIIPIADIRGVNSSVYSKGERQLRCKLASCFRLMDINGYTQGIYNHITARVSQDQEHFLINPFGLLYGEITAGSLAKIDMQGNVIDRGNTMLGVNKAGFMLHSAIHAARPDVKCIVHTHISSTVAVATVKHGLLPLTPEAVSLGKVSYHNYCGVLVNDEEKDSIARDLGPNNKVMFLRNHGVVVCGETVEEVYHQLKAVITACEFQVKMMGIPQEELVMVSDEAAELAANFNDGVSQDSPKKWRKGELEFEAEMRRLDNAGYRTGYQYKLPILKCERTDKQTHDVEYPPATSTLTYYDEMGNLKQHIKDIKERNKRMQKSDWLNTPNTYKREEIDEIGTDNPKKITKWVAATDSPSKQGASVRIENRNQFAPQGSNPKEYIQQQRQIKDGYYTDKITAGYQSKILEGGVVEGQLTDGALAAGDHIKIVGAASKGIIKREHQHNAIVYKSYYATNPFDKMSDEELKDYEDAVKRGEKPPKEEVLADIEQQLQAEVDSGDLTPSADPAVEEVVNEMENSTLESEPAIRRAQSKETNVDEALASPTLPIAAPRLSRTGERPLSPESDPNHNDEEHAGEENGQTDSPSKDSKKKKEKKEKKARMPSFSFGKKKDAKKSKVQTAV